MTRKLLLAAFALVFIALLFVFNNPFKPTPLTSGAPPYGESESAIPEIDPMDWIKDWVRPEGPAKVALQVGHWKVEEVPDELHRLRTNTGANGGGKSEWEVNYAIAAAAKDILEEKGMTVELIPATVPEKYWADVFVAVHADGNPDTTKTGYKAAASWRDFTGNADKLVDFIHEEYGRATGLEFEPSTITRNMRGYYAFSWWRYNHAIHPMTTAAILETGFLTTAADRRIIVNQPELSAQGLANGIIRYLESENLLQ
jgi:hypothetical protein